MFRFAQRVPVLVICVGLMVCATACGKKAEQTSAAAPAPAAPAALSVTAVELGRGVGGDKRVNDVTDQFKPNDVIYAAVLTAGVSSNATLKARWTYEDGQVVDESEQSIAPTGVAVSEFHISKPSGWPAGKYKVEVFLNGSSVQTKDFQVAK